MPEPTNPTPEVPVVTEPQKPDSFIQKILGDLGQNVVVAPAPEPAPEPTPTPTVPPVVVSDVTPAAPATPAPPVSPEPPPAPAARKKRAKIVNAESILPPEPAPIPAAEPPPAPVIPDDEQYISSLTEEQREELREMEVAESLYPDRHKGLQKKMVAFYKEYDQKVQKLSSEDPDRTFDENDTAFQKVLASKPRIGASESRRVQREIGTREAEERVRKNLAPQIEELSARSLENELRPGIEQMQHDIIRDVGEKLILPDVNSPIADAIKARSTTPDKITKQQKMALTVYDEEAQRAAKYAGEYVYLLRGAKKFNERDATHIAISSFINEQCNSIANSGPDITVRNGRRFLTRQQFSTMLQSNPSEASTLNNNFETKSYWTATHSQILEMFAWAAKQGAEARVVHARKMAEEFGYIPAPEQNVTPAPQNIPAAPPNTPTAPAGPRRIPGPSIPSTQPANPADSTRRPLDVKSVSGKLFSIK
jgi:hypothetical protein